MESLKLKSIFLGTNKLVILSSNIVILMILSRGLSVNDYGEYRLLTTYLLILNTILSFGLPSAIMFFLNKKSEEFLKELLYLIVLISLISPTIYIIFLLIIGNYNSSFFIVLTLVFLLNLLSLWQDNFYIVFDKIRLLFISNLTSNGILISLSFLGVYYFSWSLKEVFIALFLREFIKMLFFIYFLFSIKGKLKNKFNKKKFKKILVFVVPLFMASLVTVINMNIDKIYGSIFFTKKEFAFLANASYEIPIMSLLGYAVFNTLIPRIKNLENNNKSIVSLWNRIGEIMIVIIFPIIISIIFFSKEVITILFSDEYKSAYIIFIMYQLSALTRIYIYSTIFLALNKNQLYLMNTIVNLFVNTILIIFLGWFIGIYGVALAMLLTNVSLIIRQNNQLKKYLDCSFIDVYPLKKFVIAFTIGIIITGISFMIYNGIFTFNPMISLVFITMNILILFIVYSFTINKEIIDFLWGRLKRK